MFLKGTWGVYSRGVEAGAVGQRRIWVVCFYDRHRERIQKYPSCISLLALVTNGHFLVLFGNKTLLLFTLMLPRLFLVLAHLENANIATAQCGK